MEQSINLQTDETTNNKFSCDASAAYKNIFLNGLQIFFWILLKPRFWDKYLKENYKSLEDNFSLSEITKTQWNNINIKRLVIISLVIIPFLVSVPTGLWIIFKGGGVSLSLGLVLYIAIFSSILIFSIGFFTSLTNGIAFGGFFGLFFGISASLTNYSNEKIALISVCFVFTAISSLNFNVISSESRSHEITRRFIGIIVGIFIALLWKIIIKSIIIVGIINKTSLFDEYSHLLNWLAESLIVSIGFGLVTMYRKGFVKGLIVGLLIFPLFWFSGYLHFFYGVTFDILDAVFAGIVFTTSISLVFVVAFLVAERISGFLSGVISGACAVSVREFVSIVESEILSDFLMDLFVFTQKFSLVLDSEKSTSLLMGILAMFLGFTFRLWFPILFYPLLIIYNFILFRIDQHQNQSKSSILYIHPAFWDEHQRLPWLGLDEHLVFVAERNPVEGQQALEYLATSPYQHWAAQAAQIELDARRLERCTTTEAMGQAHRQLAAGELAGPASALLRSFSRVSQDVAYALHQETSYNQRLALSAVAERLDGLLRELTRSSEPYALRFRPIAEAWRQVIAEHLRSLTAEVEMRQEIDSPYVIGVPLTAQQEIFVGRGDVSARIEQLLLDRRRPPLLLYGQRRMGKTSLLNNLGRLLPSNIVPLFVDLQGPVAQASDHAGMWYHMARSMRESARQQRDLLLPPLTRETLERDPFGAFDEWLGEVETALGNANGLLMLDEFEALDRALSRGRFDEERVLGSLRHIIQHRPRFKILLAGSHTVDEFRRWASYLINVQVVQIGYLHEPEARQLIERPVADFALRYEPAASQSILDVTRGHPFLVQLLCAEVVALKNTHDPALRRLATLEDVADAIPEALASGDMFFADIANNQIDASGQRILHAIAAAGPGVSVPRSTLEPLVHPAFASAIHLLMQRDLIECVAGGYRFQVELIRRWFAATMNQ